MLARLEKGDLYARLQLLFAGRVIDGEIHIEGCRECKVFIGVWKGELIDVGICFFVCPFGCIPCATDSC